MLNTCKTCKHWEDRATKQFGKCRVAGMGYLASHAAELAMDRATSWPDGCEVCTGPDFGCIHHQPKEPDAG